MLRRYSKIITDKYGAFLQKNSYQLAIKLVWGMDMKKGISESRIKMKAGYFCAIDCSIEKDGETVTIYFEGEEVDSCLLNRECIITSIGPAFLKHPYFLIDDMEEFFEDMEDFLELISENVPGIC